MALRNTFKLKWPTFKKWINNTISYLIRLNSYMDSIHSKSIEMQFVMHNGIITGFPLGEFIQQVLCHSPWFHHPKKPWFWTLIWASWRCVAPPFFNIIKVCNRNDERTLKLRTAILYKSGKIFHPLISDTNAMNRTIIMV